MQGCTVMYNAAKSYKYITPIIIITSIYQLVTRGF